LAGAVKRYAAAEGEADEQSFHHNLIYNTEPNDRVPHLSYFDWLRDHGRETLANFLQRGLEVSDGWDGGGNGLHRDSGTLGRNYPATSQPLGRVGHLALSVAKPTAGYVTIAATPRESYTDNATENGFPFHYRANLNANEAHDLADSLEAFSGAAVGDPSVGHELRNYLRRWVLSDTRPRDKNPTDLDSRIEPFKGSRLARPRKYAKIDSHTPVHPLVEGFPIAHALRHLANDPKNSSNVRDLAALALTGKAKHEPAPRPEGHPEALWALHDALRDEGHPAAEWYNWMSAGDKLIKDRKVHEAMRRVAHEHAVNFDWPASRR
jgi:hypothetical protein